MVVGVKYGVLFFYSLVSAATQTHAHTHQIHPINAMRTNQMCTHTRQQDTQQRNQHSHSTHTHTQRPLLVVVVVVMVRDCTKIRFLFGTSTTTYWVLLSDTHTHTLPRPKCFVLLFSNLLDDFCLLVRRCHRRHGRAGGLVHISPAALWWCVPFVMMKPPTPTLTLPIYILRCKDGGSGTTTPMSV